MEPPKKSSQGAAAGSSKSAALKADSDLRVSSLEARVKELEQQLAKMTDVAARAQADLQNAKVRMQRDTDDLRKFASGSVIQALLPVLDNFQRAIKHLPKDLAGHEWVKGVMATEQELWKKLSGLGLQRIAALGQPVDTAKHEVITLGPGKEGVIIDVLEEGYELQGKILRVAKVRVGDGSVT